MTTYRIEIENFGMTMHFGEQVEVDSRRVVRLYRARFNGNGRELKPEALGRPLLIEGAEADSDEMMDALKPIIKHLLDNDELPGWMMSDS